MTTTYVTKIDTLPSDLSLEVASLLPDDYFYKWGDGTEPLTLTYSFGTQETFQFDDAYLQSVGIDYADWVTDLWTDNEALQIGIIENVQRSDLNPIEEAEAFQRLIDEFSYTQEVLAKTLGKSRSHIANTLRLVGASNKVRDYLVSGQLSAGHARALLGHSHADRLASEIVKQGLSVRDVERLVADKKPSKSGSKARKLSEKDTDTRALEKSIADNLGLTVAIQHDKDGGHVRVAYKTLEQLDEVVRRLMASS